MTQNAFTTLCQYVSLTQSNMVRKYKLIGQKMTWEITEGKKWIKYFYISREFYFLSFNGRG